MNPASSKVSPAYRRLLLALGLLILGSGISFAQTQPPTILSIVSTATTVTQGTSFVIVLAVSGTSPYTVQWRLNGTPVSTGTNNLGLSVSNMQAANAGTYDAVVTNSAGSATSSAVQISISYTPEIIGHPFFSSSVVVGSTPTLFVEAAGATPFSYQWRKNGTAILGATASSYTFVSASTTDVGSYDVVVTNSYGSATSRATQLTLSPAPGTPSITRTPAAPAAIAEGSTLTLQATAPGTGPFTYQWRLNGTAVAGATSATYVIPNIQTAQAGDYTVAVSNAGGTVLSYPYTIFLTYPPSISIQPANVTVLAGRSVMLTVSASGTQPTTYTWIRNGVAISTSYNSFFNLSPATASDAGQYTVIVSNEAGSVTSNPFTVTVNSPPAISTQPISQIGLLNSSITFSVAASGDAPLSYQWSKGGTAISGATSASLNLANLKATDAGTYAVTISNTYGQLKSSDVTLTVTDKIELPTITRQPVSLSVLPLGSATFSVTATGTSPLSYQWYLDGRPITGPAGATSSFTLGTVLAAFAGEYYVVVSNPAGSVQSTKVTLEVANVPAVTKQPQDQIVNTGATAVFSATISGTPPLNYQWYRNDVAIPGATSASLRIDSVGPGNAGTYQLRVFSPAFGASATTARVALTVNATPQPPVIDTQPASQTVNAGTDATFTVEAHNQDSNGFRYQWRKDGANISGATNAVLTLTSVAASASGGYSVVISSLIGSATSSTATLTVNPPPAPAQISRQPADVAAALGGSATIDVVATGAAPITYQWRKNGTTIAGATSSSLVLASVTASDVGSYTVVVANSVGSVTSSAAQLTLSTSRIVNLSVRARLVTNRTLITGFVMSGAEKSVLVRASGPALQPLLGPTATVAGDPVLNLYDGTGALVQANDNWGGGATLADAFASVGAFAFPAASKDAALIRSVSGGYTAHVLVSDPGIGLVEIYDLGKNSASRLINVSARYEVTSGDGALVAGFVIAGDAQATLLIRGIGPALQDLFGVTGVLADPKVEVFNASGAKVAENDNWDATLVPVFTRVGAYSPKTGSKDAALSVTLSPGAYSVQVTGVGGSTGDAIVEVYEIPPSGAP